MEKNILLVARTTAALHKSARAVIYVEKRGRGQAKRARPQRPRLEMPLCGWQGPSARSGPQGSPADFSQARVRPARFCSAAACTLRKQTSHGAKPHVEASAASTRRKMLPVSRRQHGSHGLGAQAACRARRSAEQGRACIRGGPSERSLLSCRQTRPSAKRPHGGDPRAGSGPVADQGATDALSGGKRPQPPFPRQGMPGLNSPVQRVRPGGSQRTTMFRGRTALPARCPA